jgi:hypothetical protein
MPAGRPTKFDKLDLDQVKSLATRGWTDQEMADHFKVARSTWSKWKIEHPEFSDTLKDWKDEADKRVERSLYERALGYNHPQDKIFNDSGKPLIVPTIKHYPPDTTAMIFWLKNRQPEDWRDKVETEHSGKIGFEGIERVIIDPEAADS